MIRRNCLRIKGDKFLVSLKVGMRLLQKEERLLRRNWIILMIRLFRSIMRDLYRNVIFVKGLLTKRLLLDIRRFVVKRNH